MESKELKITYLFHSGFAIHSEDKLLIFDYYRGKPGSRKRNIADGYIEAEYLGRTGQVYVFVTHNHKDHFNPEIYGWAEEKDNIQYILSRDVSLLPERNYHLLGRYEKLGLEQIQIETYGSTDQGVSFLVGLDGIHIYHAGDLNWWHWKEFSPEEQQREEEDFKREVRKLQGKDIDIAFFPVDPRLEEYYYLGGEYFAREVQPDLLIPMHFGKNNEISRQFAARNKELKAQSVEINRPGQVITYRKSSS
ncbi:MAG: MBL fold metallo-hydrolase [Halanaerobium sp.]|nr:MBL fold metallo-hydrolase [Halanaerobium sp.]